jgi:AraC family transcriptional regulator of arabinose operon
MTKSTGLHFLHSGFTAHCSTRVDKYFDGYYTLQFMTIGAVELFYGQQRYEMTGPWFWPAYPGPHIRFHPAPGHVWWEHRYVAFQGSLVNEWKAANIWLEAPQKAHSAETVRRCFDELLLQARRTNHWGILRAINLLERLLLELAEQRNQPLQQEPWLDTALAYLSDEENFMPDYTYLAHKCGLGQSTLRRRFKEATGVSLHTYVLQKRISAARTLLGETDLPIKAIAEQLGYRDVYFFSRQFRTLTGITPALYRKSRQV